ncbi:MAG: hypothetical protein KatS3mg003_1658 [Candidatus Nitrosocaldaceae archaeon]|nr:MAG: hypothetical protein KatS3mg003_1658 [Candidatus Nitrosocaldaceae archaeon]
MFQYYTPQQANRVLPEIKNKVRLLIKLKDHIMLLQDELARAASLDSLQIYIEKKQELNKAIANLYKGIEELESMGIIIKSLEQGLLDFPSKRFDEEVWLCWKLGEDEVKFWHGKDEGFAGRKPLPVNDESLV